MNMKRIAIFASGGGTNAQNITNYFKDSDLARVAFIVTDNPQAGVLVRAAMLGVECVVIDREAIRDGAQVLAFLQGNKIDYVVLAGFLRLMPSCVVDAYKGRIVNIHPALLPNYGGKGMYGDNVHKAVVAAGEKESGITIHHVTENYDEGAVIAQVKCPVEPTDDHESLAERIHALEYEHFPKVIEQELIKLK